MSTRWAFVGAVLAILPGCAEDGVESGRFVGDVDGTDTVIGVVIEEGTGLAYVCGGEEDKERHHHWIELSSVDGTFAGTTTSGGLELTVEMVAEGDDLSGTIEGGDESLSFTASAAAETDGPWRPEQDLDPCEAGVVVRGGSTAMQGVHYCDITAEAAQVIPIELISGDLGRIEVELETDPGVQFAIVPAVP